MKRKQAACCPPGSPGILSALVLLPHFIEKQMRREKVLLRVMQQIPNPRCPGRHPVGLPYPGWAGLRAGVRVGVNISIGLLTLELKERGLKALAATTGCLLQPRSLARGCWPSVWGPCLSITDCVGQMGIGVMGGMVGGVGGTAF